MTRVAEPERDAGIVVQVDDAIDGWPGGYHQYVLAMLFIVFTLNFLDRQIISILASAIKQDLALSDTQLGLMGGLAFALLYTLMGLPMGILADRVRRTGLVGFAIILWSMFTALCGTATGFASLFASRVGVGIGESGGVTPCYSLISDYFRPAQRARALSVFALGVPIGSGLGLLIGGYVAHALGWRAAFVIVGAVGIVFAPLFFFTVREPRRGGLDAHAPTAPASIRAVLRVLNDKPAFWLVSVASGVTSMMSYGLAFWLPSFFQRGLGLSLTTTAQVMAAMTVVSGLIGMPLGGYLADRLGARRRVFYAYLPALSSIVALPCLVAGISADSLIASIVLLAIPMGCGCFWVPAALAAMQNLLPPHMRTTGASVYALIVNLLGLGAGTSLFGMLSDHFHQQYGEQSLHYSVIAGALVVYPAAVLLYWAASRWIEADWEGAVKPTWQGKGGDC